jgi:dihydrolipoamide dehydrogenase
VFTSDGVLEERRFYKRLIIIGGGVIGVELGSVYNSLGCEVTIIEAMDRLLPMMDKEISQNLTMIFKKRGVTVHTGASVTGITREGDGLKCAFSTKKGDDAVVGDGVLISVGRRPNTASVFAEGCAPEMVRGFIQVNDRYESSIPGIYAIGDCNGKLQLAHAAEAQAMACVEYIAGKDHPTVNPNVVPSGVYTDPEIACVGITADDAKAKGIPVITGKYVMSGNAKTLMERTERSFIKVVFHAETDVLLGAQMMCPRATDMLSELSDAVVNGLTSSQLLAALRPHPTFVESVTEAIEAAHGSAIHVMPSKR